MAGPGDGNKVGHGEGGEVGLDLDSGLWAGVVAGEREAAVRGGWLADVHVMAAEDHVCKPEEVQGVWDG